MKQWHIHHVDKRRGQLGKPRGIALVQSASRVPEGVTTDRVAWLIDLVHNRKAIHKHLGHLKFDVVDPDTGLTIKAEKPPPRKCPVCSRLHTQKGKACSVDCRRTLQGQTRRRRNAEKAEAHREALLAAYSALGAR